MLFCSLDSVQPGTEVAASVFHPRRPNVELLRPGVPLDRVLLIRLKDLGVKTVWVACDATADLDAVIPTDIGQTRRAAYEQLKQDFSRLAHSTITAGDVQSYRQIIMDLVLELMGNRNLAGLSDQLFSGPRRLFTHGANVAYLSVLGGLRLESYVIQQRGRLDIDHARDLTNLGVGAMLHDIGKIAWPTDAARRNALYPETGAVMEPPGENEEPDTPPYRAHVRNGYDMLLRTQTPATAKQIVLNHHQRWDGTGFPDQSPYTHKRKTGPQQGEQIHVFCRIVAVADALEHLLCEGEGAPQPIVAALHALKSERFDGWFDPIVRDTMLRCLPPFPVGVHVTLSDGRQAVVITPSMDQPCRPTVRLLAEMDGSYPTIDLQTTPELHIAEAAGQAVEPYLFELPRYRPALLQRVDAMRENT